MRLGRGTPTKWPVDTVLFSDSIIFKLKCVLSYIIFFIISILSSMTSFISSNEIFSPYFPKNPKEPVVSLCHPKLIWVILQLVKSWLPNYLSRLEVASDKFHRVHLWIHHKRWSLYAEEHHDGGFQIGHTLHLCIYLAYVGLYVIL